MNPAPSSCPVPCMRGKEGKERQAWHHSLDTETWAGVTELCPQHAIFGFEGLLFQSCIHDIMSIFQPKTTEKTKGQKDNRASRLPCGRETLELADWELETATINMLEALMGRLEYTQKQMGTVIREWKLWERTKKKILHIKDTDRNAECLAGVQNLTGQSWRKDWRSSNNKQQNRTVRGKMPRTCDMGKNENKNNKKTNRILDDDWEEFRQWKQSKISSYHVSYHLLCFFSASFCLSFSVHPHEHFIYWLHVLLAPSSHPHPSHFPVYLVSPVAITTKYIAAATVLINYYPLDRVINSIICLFIYLKHISCHLYLFLLFLLVDPSFWPMPFFFFFKF